MCIGYYNFFPSQSGTKGKEYLKVKKKEDENGFNRASVIAL